MQTPSATLATLRPELRSFEEFDLEMSRQGFIGTQVAPVVEVAKASGTFGKIPIEELLRTPDTVRAPGSGYSRSAHKFTTDSYTTQEHGHEFPVDDNQAAVYSDFFDAEMKATQRCYDAILRAQERRIAALIFNTTTWTGASLTTGVSNVWSASNGTPVADVEAACQKVWSNSGLWPNTLILTRLAFRALRHSDDIINRIKYWGGDDPKQRAVTAAVLAQVFDLDRVIVADSIKNTANEAQSASLASLWDKTMAMVCHINPSSDVSVPTLARLFHYGEDGSQIGGTIETYREEQTRSQIVRVRHQVGEKVMYPELGHLLTAVLS